jgi:hypothetical protein
MRKNQKKKSSKGVRTAEVFLNERREKTIAVTCRTGDSLELEKIVLFQGEFKSRTEKDIDKIKKSILKHGISFPFFIWSNNDSNFCMDGHGRYLALTALRNSGYFVPPVPAVYIQAEDEADAKQRMLRLNSRYGMVTKDSVLGFIENIDVNIKLDLECFEIPGPAHIFFDMAVKDLELYFDDPVGGDDERKNAVKICPHCGKVLP